MFSDLVSDLLFNLLSSKFILSVFIKHLIGGIKS